MKKKFSSYNIFVPYQNKIIAYNSIKDSFLLLDNDLYELLNASINENNIEELYNIHPDFFTALLNEGFIINKTKDEYKYLKNEISKIDNDDSFFDIIINPTMNCNFKCWYCYETHIKESKLSPQMVKKIFKLIDNSTSNEKIQKLYISWFGGEPLLFFEKSMVPVLLYANKVAKHKKIIFESDITTNGLLINQEMINQFKILNIVHLQITIDGNRSLHNKIRFVNEKRGSYDEIMNNVKLLCKNEISTTLRINFTKETLINIHEIIKDLADLTMEERSWLEISFHQVWQTKDKDDVEIKKRVYELKKQFKTLGFFIADNQNVNFKNSCYADKKNEAVINYNGDVYKCTARDFNKNNREGVLLDDGSINWFENNERRQKSKLNNKPCQTCPILPLCGSGCSQVAYESNGDDYCVYDFDFNRKKEVVLEHFIEKINL